MDVSQVNKINLSEQRLLHVLVRPNSFWSFCKGQKIAHKKVMYFLNSM